MGRTYLAEERIQSILDTGVNSKRATIGIIVGQPTLQQKDYVVHAVETPQEEGWSGTLDTVSDGWVANHAKQVQCMIPGGLKIVGLFAVGNPEELKSAPVKLRQMLFAVHKLLDKMEMIPEDPETRVNDRVVLQMCSLTRKITCRTFDVFDPKSAAKPADWKYQSFLDRWITLSANISVDFHIPITTEMGNKSFRKQIQTGLQPTCENISNSLAVLNNQLYKDTDPLDTSQPPSAGKKKGKKEEVQGLSFQVDLFSQMTKTAMVPDVKFTDCCAKMYVRGTMCCRAFVHNKSLAKDAIKALKTDAIMTICRRCELLCEELVDEEEQDPRILYETPRRVFTKLPGTSLDVCDYVFMDETTEDIQQRLQEVMGLKVAAVDIDDKCEKIPEDVDLVKPDNSMLLQQNSGSKSETSQGGTLKYVGFLVGGAVAALAAGFSYFFIGDR